MTQTLLATNPFAMLLDPQAVVADMERSDRLARLKRRVCRPLDRPLIPKTAAVAAADAAVDAEILDDADVTAECDAIDAIVDGDRDDSALYN